MKLIVVLAILCLLSSSEARCRMRGECIEIGGFPKSCPVDIEAPILVQGLSPSEADEIIRILGNRCPTFVYDELGEVKPYGEIRTCCDPVQVRKMSESLSIAEGVLGRCPTCLRNFARQICEMNCSPDQSNFVDVYTEISANNIEYVNEIDYRLYESFMLDAHTSCAGVLVPQTGTPAINIMCGNALVCDADAWFGFTGDTSTNPLAPVQVNFFKWPTTEDSMNATAPLCEETAEGDWPCSCVDCPAVCPIGNEPFIPEICTVINVNCIGLSVGITLFVITVTIFCVLTIIQYRKSRNVNNDTQTLIPNDSVFTKFFQKLFARIGVFSASYPSIIIMITTWIAFAMFFGVINLNITSNPIELWSAPDSKSRNELNYFNSRFGPFYRAAQVFLTFKGLEPFQVGNMTYGPAFRIEAMQELIKLEDDIINIGKDTGGVTLAEVCYAPLRGPGGEVRFDQCVSMSVSVYLGEDRNNINEDTYLGRIQDCLNNFYALNCMASWGGGSEPEITFGGYEEDIYSANTLLINFPIANHLLEENLRPVLEWEEKFLELLHDYEANRKPDYVEVAYGAERSIEDEIRRVSEAEAVPIAISYIIMFIYVTISLGKLRSCKTWLIDSKIMVAVCSILIVVNSIYCALGLMGYTGVTTTLLAINVIPFFILSVGIDNVFLMVNTLSDIEDNLKQYDDYDTNFSSEKRKRFVFEKMMSAIGPSMFVSSITQITCFGIGSLSNFPAVVTFAIFASFSLGFLFIFQITTVVAILAIDYTRGAQNRLDVLCCIQTKIIEDEDPLKSATPHKGITQKLMEPYSKVITDWRVRIIVVIIFMLMVSISVVLIPQIEVGLDQEMALPIDSYVYRYLQAVDNLMVIGPPVFFVLKSGLNFSDPNHQNTICGSQMCYEDSLITQIFLASRHSNITYIERSSNSWLDDFFDWSSLYGACCKYNTTDGSFCQSTDMSPDCSYCTIERGEFANGLRPASVAFDNYIPFFLRDEPTDICNKGGLASYYSYVNYELDSEGRATVHDTAFMAYHSTLSTSQDYITAVKYGYEISENITKAIQLHTRTDVEVFPYSIFYVFYEQYTNMWGDTFASLGYCLIGALVFNLLASGFNIITTFAVIFTSILVLVNMMGVMYIWSIPLNAVSCVNLIVSIGIAVEFCSHIAYAYSTSKKPSNERVADAIVRIGATVITGITFTNIPIIVLSFSYTEIIEVFFFRMFFSVVILGFIHGMIFLPVLLSYLNDLRRT